MFENFDIRNLMLMIVPVLLALTVHEYAHGLAAYRLGGDTAKNEGRLTLNPLPHLDPLGTIMIFFSGLFGWAKPVPFNPRNFKNPVRDTTLVALAGPASNFATAIVLTVIFKLLIYFNFFSLIPMGLVQDLVSIFYLAVLVNISLGLFNLLPIPPLDGFKILSYFLPSRWVMFAYQNSMVFMILFLVLVVSGMLSKVFSPLVYFLFQILIG